MGGMLAVVAFTLMIFFPIMLVVFNRRFSKRQKLVGVLVSLCFSWLGFILFYVLTALDSKASSQTD
ncbi:MAG: hypothetical protein KA144_01895 [Xanthomonadaceae bacterium]|nr:hypothetical protein [Xanthomonadaceae bacterium]